jgi:hypothetical protein
MRICLVSRGSYGITGLAGDEQPSARIMRAPSHSPTTEPGVEMIVPPVLVAQNFTGKSEVESRKAGVGGRAGPIGMRCLVRVGLFYSGDPDLWAACGSRVGWSASGSGNLPGTRTLHERSNLARTLMAAMGGRSCPLTDRATGQQNELTLGSTSCEVVLVVWSGGRDFSPRSARSAASWPRQREHARIIWEGTPESPLSLPVPGSRASFRALRLSCEAGRRGLSCWLRWLGQGQNSTTAHVRHLGGNPQPSPWLSYSRNVRRPLLRCSLEFA